MAIMLSDEQLGVVKQMLDYSMNFADQIYHIMENHGLTEMYGAELTIEVNPRYTGATKVVNFGRDIDYDCGHVELTRGKEEKRYVPTGKNSPEYEYLFADPAIKERLRKIVDGEKPLPPDGLWIGDSRNDPPVDCGDEVNDLP